MKKISLTLAVASALGASAANAAIMAEYANGIVVPRVFYDSAENQDTAIGLTACHGGTVYWAFYNAGSVKQADGQFEMTTNDQASLVWSDPRFSGTGLEGVNGYMTFLLDTDSDQRLSLNDSTCLAGNAYFVDTSSRDDVAFVPVFPLNFAWGDFRTTPDGSQTAFNLRTPDGRGDIIGMWAGNRAGDTLHLRYFIDNPKSFQSGNDTQIYIWGANPFSFSGSVDQFDSVQSRRSMTLTVSGELAILDPEATNQTNFSSLAAFTDGFFEWTLPLAVVDRDDFIESPTNPCTRDSRRLLDYPDQDDTFCLDDYNATATAVAEANRSYNGVVSWSIVSSDSFQATQTLLNPAFKPHIADGDGVVEPGERFNIFERYNPNGLIPVTQERVGTIEIEETFEGDELGEGDDIPNQPPSETALRDDDEDGVPDSPVRACSEDAIQTNAERDLCQP